jgi:hypothetical protein
MQQLVEKKHLSNGTGGATYRQMTCDQKGVGRLAERRNTSMTLLVGDAILTETLCELVAMTQFGLSAGPAHPLPMKNDLAGQHLYEGGRCRIVDGRRSKAVEPDKRYDSGGRGADAIVGCWLDKGDGTSDVTPRGLLQFFH